MTWDEYEYEYECECEGTDLGGLLGFTRFTRFWPPWCRLITLEVLDRHQARLFGPKKRALSRPR